MARVETPRSTAASENPPADEHLDEWFTRRLESQGIPSRLGAPPLSRIAAVIGLALAALGLLWALSSVGPKTTTVTPPASTGTGGTTSTGGGDGNSNGHFVGKVTWRKVTVDVLNGTGSSGAAGAAATTLSDAGWKVGTTGNASGIAKTEVVYLAGFKAEALAVAKKLGLVPPVKIGDATGVVPSSTTGVAIVLGPDGLPPV